MPLEEAVNELLAPQANWAPPGYKPTDRYANELYLAWRLYGECGGAEGIGKEGAGVPTYVDGGGSVVVGVVGVVGGVGGVRGVGGGTVCGVGCRVGVGSVVAVVVVVGGGGGGGVRGGDGGGRVVVVVGVGVGVSVLEMWFSCFVFVDVDVGVGAGVGVGIVILVWLCRCCCHFLMFWPLVRV